MVRDLTLGNDHDAIDLRLVANSLGVQVQKGPQNQIRLLCHYFATILYSDMSEITIWDIQDLGDREYGSGYWDELSQLPDRDLLNMESGCEPTLPTWTSHRQI